MSSQWGDERVEYEVSWGLVHPSGQTHRATEPAWIKPAIDES